ncbi:MAG: tetraacyldisaccharide 4'-kinase [Candidatus Cloacimonetes bacterium]|nr:tetraacyldisaccharide 4'-kinase [Candidatus Cloacimonadota bacterium]
MGNGFVIPAGYLREPLSAIPKQAIILLHSKDVTPVNDILQKALCPLRQPIFSARSHASKILNGDNELDPNSLKGQSISLVSAIAHPESFESSVRALGLSFAPSPLPGSLCLYGCICHAGSAARHQPLPALYNEGLSETPDHSHAQRPPALPQPDDHS